MPGNGNRLMLFFGMFLVGFFCFVPFVSAQNIVDTDKDGLGDDLETKFGTTNTQKDTDGDGYDDFTEVMNGYSPTDRSPTVHLGRELVVNRTTQQMDLVIGGIVVKKIPVSTGNPGTETPAGTFSINKKIQNKRYVGPGYDLKNVLYNMQFKEGGYYIHTAYWHNDFGKSTHSHGCINVNKENAAFLYKYLGIGTKVVVEGTTPKKRKVGT